MVGWSHVAAPATVGTSEMVKMTTTTTTTTIRRTAANVATLSHADAIAADWRREGFRVGVRGQTVNGQHSGLFTVVGTRRTARGAQ